MLGGCSHQDTNWAGVDDSCRGRGLPVDRVPASRWSQLLSRVQQRQAYWTRRIPSLDLSFMIKLRRGRLDDTSGAEVASSRGTNSIWAETSSGDASRLTPVLQQRTTRLCLLVHMASSSRFVGIQRASRQVRDGWHLPRVNRCRCRDGSGGGLGNSTAHKVRQKLPLLPASHRGARGGALAKKGLYNTIHMQAPAALDKCTPNSSCYQDKTLLTRRLGRDLTRRRG